MKAKYVNEILRIVPPRNPISGRKALEACSEDELMKLCEELQQLERSVQVIVLDEAAVEALEQRELECEQALKDFLEAAEKLRP